MTLLDDSGSMRYEDDGERLKDLKLIYSRVVPAAMLFDDDGISVRFMKWVPQDPPRDPQQRRDGIVYSDMLDGIRSEQVMDQVIVATPFQGMTPLGRGLREHVLEPLVVKPARNGQLQKPVLIIAITDGQPVGEPKGSVHDAILYASSELARTRYGQGAVSFQFAQVGVDEDAAKFLAALDSDPQIGTLVDCTSGTSYPLLPGFQAYIAILLRI